MGRLESLLARRRLILSVAGLLSVTGLVLWLTMDRREDPHMPAYWGQVVAVYPGADAEMVERLVLDPIEDALAEVEEVRTVASTAWAEVAVLEVDLVETTDDTDTAWDEVRRALVLARSELPAGAGEPELNAKLSTDHDAVVVALTGSADPLELLDAARRLRDELLAVPTVARVKVVGDPGEQVTVELDDAVARRLGLSAPIVAAQLAGRTQIVPGGSLAVGERTVRLRPRAEMGSVAEIAAAPIRLPSGATLPLGEVARVRLGPREPAGERMRLDGEMAVGLGVVPKEKVNAVRFGSAVRAALEETAPALAPVKVRMVAFQPDRVASRLAELNRSLLLGIVIVAGVVILAMGLRLGLVVASVVPLVALAALAVFAVGGGVLHQISIAALVLALGMLVDNAIVVAENVQRRLDRGEEPRAAAVAAVRELAVPLAAATGTTVAAFLPMPLASSSTGDFTRSIPVMVILALVISYLFAVLVTPVLSERALIGGSSRATALTAALGRIASSIAVRRTGWVLAGAALLVALSAVGARAVRSQFFPGADRNQLVVDLKLPEGAHLDATDEASRTLERLLAGRDEVVQVASFVGRGAPRFYYNIHSVPWSPHFAQLMVTTRRTADVERVLSFLREAARRELPGVEVIGRRLEQGPPVGAPVEVRLSGHDLLDLQAAATAVAGALREVAGAADVRHDLGSGEPTLQLSIDDAAAARHGLTRAEVARALYGHTRGWPVGELRSGEDPVPIVVRSAAGERTAVSDLASLDVPTADGRVVPLAQVARSEVGWRPAAVNHRDRSRVATVSAQLAEGAAYSDVLDGLAERLETLQLPVGVRVAYGGEAEGSGEANTALFRTLPLGLLVLLAVLLAEFNSFRRVGLILVTVPLAATGVVPGLLVASQPFGFMSLLGVFALVGIVVNNAIVLLEVVESRRRAGSSVDVALEEAIQQRIRPILLTSATTVAGLLPLAFSPSTLWPPLAWAMISGLVASTGLTLVVVPALYRVLFGGSEAGAGRRQVALPAAAMVAAILALAAPAEAQQRALSLEEALRLGADRPAASAAGERARSAEQAGLAERRVAYLPSLTASVAASERDRDLELVTPIGSFPFGDRRTTDAAIGVRQPLLDPARLLHANPATRLESDASRLEAERTRQELAVEAGVALLELLAVEARQSATSAFADSLRGRLEETEARVDAGRALGADALKIRLALERAELELLALNEAHQVAVAALARATGLDGEVAAAPAPDWLGRPVPGLDRAVEAALRQRPDLAALDRAGRALERRRSAVRAEALPRLDAAVSWSWSDGSPYAQEQWTAGAVVLTWSPFEAGTRGPRAAALAAERNALAADLEEARRGVAVEVRAALAELATARAAVAVAGWGVEQAGETLRVEAERHAAGRSTTNDLLEAEAAVRRERTARDLARLDVVRTHLRLALATGELPAFSDRLPDPPGVDVPGVG